MALVNIDKLYFAKMLKDEIGKGNLIFDIPEYIPGIQQFGAKIKTNTGKLYEEGILTDQDTTLEDIELSFDLGHIDNITYAKYLGHHVAAAGGVYALEDDKAPYIAVLIEYTKNGGIKGYKVYYKGQLTEPDDAIKQKEGKIDYQNHSVSSTFQPLKNNGMWKYTVEENDPNCPDNIGSLFFANVIIPTEDTASPKVTSVPADGATGVAATVDIVLTSDKAMAAGTINTDNILLMKSDGTMVASTLSIDDTKKIVTLKPNTDLAAGSYICICNKNVKSVGNVPMESNLVVNFSV